MKNDRRNRLKRVKVITPEEQELAEAALKKRIEEQKIAEAKKAAEAAARQAIKEFEAKVAAEAAALREAIRIAKEQEHALAEAQRKKIELAEENKKRRAAMVAMLAAENMARARKDAEEREARLAAEDAAHKWVWNCVTLKQLSRKARDMFLVSGWQPLPTQEEIQKDPFAFRMKWELKARNYVEEK